MTFMSGLAPSVAGAEAAPEQAAVAIATANDDEMRGSMAHTILSMRDVIG
jgi:hypothetical protein